MMIEDRFIELGKTSELSLKEHFEKVDLIREKNFLKVLDAFQNVKLHDSDLNYTSGYGYNDIGREKTEAVFARIFGGEDALVRPQIISGTHAISITLFGLLRPGDLLVYASGKPYETGEGIIGIREVEGSLKESGVKYGEFNFRNGFDENLVKNAKVLVFQRSKGYTFTDSITIDELENAIKIVKSINPQTIIMVDNCYGEFVEDREPGDVGADVVVGSLIKNVGGGIAITGGYIVGKKDLIQKISTRLTAPGVGKEIGPMLGLTRNILQGIYFAPLVVSNALKGVIFASKIFEDYGFEVKPRYFEKRTDIVQAIKFGSEELLIKFAQSIQRFSPIDSDAEIVSAPLPGYGNKVIMAAGTFVQGSSIELSCDAPIVPPYIGYLQGGIYYEHTKFASLYALQEVLKISKK
ncbi:MAG: aminotransferase class I/II-fold pyridoxal phosphate-dependent enzyme [Caldisericum sp.]|uniref:methionine gamma-lyase family protein n=1 Tax=Caldisericum TaxID=693074 RepID=UPI003C76C986